MDMNKGGRWPAVIETEDGVAEISEIVRVDFRRGKRQLPLSPYDLAEGMPEYQDSLSTGALAAAIFVSGLVVSVVGVWLLTAPLWAKLALAFGCGLFTHWVTQKVRR